MAFHGIRLIFSTNASWSSLTNKTSPGRPGIGFCFGWARPQSVISYGTYDITRFISAINLILALYWTFWYIYCNWPFYIFIYIISFNSTHIYQVYSDICLEYNIYFQVNWMLRGDRIVFPKLKEMASWKLCRLPFCSICLSWWRHQMETFSALLVICAGNSPVNSTHRDQWPQAVMFSLISVCINGSVNNREDGDLRRYRPHYVVSVMYWPCAVQEWGSAKPIPFVRLFSPSFN